MSELRATCEAAARAGARVLRDLFDKPRDVHFKGRIDLVTDADRAAEEAVLRVLHERAPGARVLAEESGAHAGGDVRFIVDPLDGTTNYAHGLPLFCCTVGAEVGGVVQAGCTVDPLRDEVFTASRGQGAFRNGQRLAVSRADDLQDALLCSGFPVNRGGRLEQMLAVWARFTAKCRGTRRLGSAALDLAYVASGKLDGFWELGLKPWDVAAGVLLVEEAGGLVTRYDGSPMPLEAGELLAAGPALHALMKDVLTS